jgi:hypothetical protein
MSQTELICLIGISHLLQPPLTLLLASGRGLNLRAALKPSTPISAPVLHNMAVAAVLLPTAFGLLLAIHADDTQGPGAARSLGLVLSLFWCWRLHRQLFVLGPLWPRASARALFHWLLVAIFTLQGPGLGIVLLT